MITPGWYNLNEKRAYPFVDQTTSIPDRAIVDAGVVMLPMIEFVTGTHKMRLSAIQDTGGGDYVFIFTTDAPLMVRLDSNINFTVSKTAPPYTVVRGIAGGSGGDDPAIDCDIDLISMFVVFGDLTTLYDVIPEGTTVPVEGNYLEPSTIENLADSYISSITVANKERTLASAPLECPEFDWSDRPDYWILNSCMVGQFRFVAGYNIKVQQNDLRNQIQLSIQVREGNPQPCETLQLHPDEAPPDWSIYLDGSVACFETVRSLGGAGGPNLIFSSRQGVAVSTVPGENKVIVDINFSGLIVCPSEVEFV